MEKWKKTSIPCDIALFSSCGVDVVLAEGHIGYVSPDVFTDLGRDPKEADIVVCAKTDLSAG